MINQATIQAFYLTRIQTNQFVKERTDVQPQASKSRIDLPVYLFPTIRGSKPGRRTTGQLRRKEMATEKNRRSPRPTARLQQIAPQAAGLETEAVGTAAMAMPGAAPHYFSHPNYANSPLPGNMRIRVECHRPGAPAAGANAWHASDVHRYRCRQAFVYLAYTQGAVYNALVAIEGGYSPYNSSLLPADPNASRDAAVAAAAYGVLKNYFPMDATLDGEVCRFSGCNRRWS